MVEGLVSSGSDAIDWLLDGGYESEVITTIFGPSGSGKSNLCLALCKSVSEQGKRVLYVDTEGNFSLPRFLQLSDQSILGQIEILKPTNFLEQREIFKKLNESELKGIGAIIVDSIAVFYRLGVGESKEVQEINREFGMQVSWLNEICRKKGIPVIITNQVYSSFDDKNSIKMVGGDIILYRSKCLIELKKLHRNRRSAILRKHRSIAEGKEVIFEIKEKGIYKV